MLPKGSASVVRTTRSLRLTPEGAVFLEHCRSALAAGRLIALCQDWRADVAPLYMVLPDRRQLTPALRLLREFMAAKLS